MFHFYPLPLAAISPWLIAPFALLLLLIAVMPLAPAGAKHWWERNYPVVAVGLATLVIAYYALRVEGGGQSIAHAAGEYFSFIALVASLYVVAGGIHLGVRGDATPRDNVAFLFGGAVLANFIGTTGASMILIRPFLSLNQRRASAHHVVFFIFLVSNLGGALTPIGDPPLFLGYLRGIPFFWLLPRVMAPWLTVVGATLGVFYFFDRRSAREAAPQIPAPVGREHAAWRLDGKFNLLFLAIVVGAVFAPAKYFLREILMLATAAASYRLTPRAVHAANHFEFGPIKEVAWLFAGIFATMMPALNFLEEHGRAIPLTQPAHYYFATGSVSAVLDNAPAYANFLKLAEVRAVAPGVAESESIRELLLHQPLLVVAISLAAVFFGAMTYIGNGPNFMVKAIAERAGAPTPSFFGYIFKYSLPVLLPILAAAAWIFL